MDYLNQIANLRKLAQEVLAKPRELTRQSLVDIISGAAEAQMVALLNGNDAMRKTAELAYKVAEKTFDRYQQEFMNEHAGPMDGLTREKFLTIGYCANLIRDYPTLESLEAAALDMAREHIHNIPS